MHKKIKIIISATVMAIAMTGVTPVPATTQTVITVEAAAKPSLNKKSATLTAGQTLQLKVKNTTKTAKWFSSDKKVVSVSSKGLVKAKKNGTATITAKIGKEKYRCTVKVKTLKVKSLKIAGASSVEAGSTAQLSVSVSPSNAANKKIKWTSSNTKIASVSSKGVVTAKKEGSVTITAATTDGSKKRAKKKITVVKIQSVQITQYPQYPTTDVELNQYETTDIRKLAPKADECVLHAFEYLGFKVEKNNYAQYSGYFTVKERRIYLRKLSGTTIYHELGHFVAWISGNRDTTGEFKAIYEKEKNLVTSYNRQYTTQSSSEYFAESYREYCLDPGTLKKQRPNTYAAIEKAVKYLDGMGNSKLASVKQAYEQVCWR